MITEAPTIAYDIVRDPRGEDGWSGGGPPMSWEEWPTSGGVPMRHLFTIAVPPSYRTRAKDLVALSVFRAFNVDGPTGAFARGHANTELVEAIGSPPWAIVWLTKREFDRPRCEPPPHPNRIEEAMDANLRLVPRKADPNVGRPYPLAPEDDDTFYGRSHFGGTGAGAGNFDARMCGPIYLEFDERLASTEMNEEGYSCAIDLETGKANVDYRYY